MFSPKGTCLKLEAPINGRKLGKSHSVGHEVHFLCDPGYELVGSESRTCQESLAWSGQQTACKGNHLLPGLSVTPPLCLLLLLPHSVSLLSYCYLPANHFVTLIILFVRLSSSALLPPAAGCSKTRWCFSCGRYGTRAHISSFVIVQLML